MFLVTTAMLNDLTIQAVHATSASSVKAHPPVPAVPPVAPSQPHTNPSLRLDSALGLVVIEFRNDAGTVTHSIPNQRQIDAYRMHEKTPPGPEGSPPDEQPP